MMVLSVWVFDSPDDGPELGGELTGLGELGAPEIAVVRWPADSRQPEMEVSGDRGSDLLEQPFWPVVLGLIFRVPLLGAALAQPAGPSSDPLLGTGLDDLFLNRVRDEVVPGTSALFALVPAGALPTVRAAVAGCRSLRWSAEVSGAREAALFELLSARSEPDPLS